MESLFGMAGLAEAGEGFALMIAYGGLLMIGLPTAVAFFARSRIAAGIALTVTAAFSLLFMPWEAFRSFQSNDPDEHYWMSAWRRLAASWVVVSAAVLVAAVRAFGSAPKLRTDNKPQADGE